MPRIPIADIPNAPKVSPGPVPMEVPHMRADLSRATRSLMTPTLELDAFSGEAKGIAHLGEAGPKVAAVLEDARQRKQEFQDAVSLALYDKRMREAYARYKESLPGQPESAYLAGWQKAQAQEREAALKDIAVSERGRAGLSRYDADFSRRTAGEMVTLASHTAVERGTGEILAQAHRSFARGHDEDAYAISERLVELGAFTREQSDTQIAAWKETRRMEFLTSAMERLPREFAQELRSMVQTGKSEPLQDAVRKPEEARQWLNKAERHWRETQSATRQEVFGSIVAQKLTRADQIVAAGRGHLDEADLQAARQAQGNYGRPLDYTTYGRLRLATLAYDATADADGSGLAALDREIVAHVRGDEAAFLLKQAREPASTNRRRLAGFFQKVESYARTGRLGETGRDAEGRILDPQKAQLAGQKAELLRLNIEHFLQKNPDLPAPELTRQFREIVKSSGLLRSSVQIYETRNSASR